MKTDPLTYPLKYFALACELGVWFKNKSSFSKVEATERFEPSWSVKRWMTHGALAILEAWGLIVRNDNCTFKCDGSYKYVEYDVVQIG